ncbi:MAG: hypothetical protein WD314_16420 [Trueperaceae bacterium]
MLAAGNGAAAGIAEPSSPSLSPFLTTVRMPTRQRMTCLLVTAGLATGSGLGGSTELSAARRSGSPVSLVSE